MLTQSFQNSNNRVATVVALIPKIEYNNQAVTIREQEQLSEADLLLLHESFVRQLPRQSRNLLSANAPNNKLPPPPPPPTTTTMNNKRKKDIEFERLLSYNNKHIDDDDGAASSSGVMNTKESAFDCRVSGVCNSGCSFYQPRSLNENIFICTKTGRLHQCTASSCEFLDVDTENRVCKLTCLSYPLDTPVIPHDYHEHADTGKSNTQPLVESQAKVEKREKKRLKLQQEQRALEEATISNQALLQLMPATATIQDSETSLTTITTTTMTTNTTTATTAATSSSSSSSSALVANTATTSMTTTTMTTTTMSVPKRKTKPKRPKPIPYVDPLIEKREKERRNESVVPSTEQAKYTQEQMVCIAVKFIKKLIPSLREKEQMRLALICTNLWTKLTETKYYKKVQHRYKFHVHCAVVLYNTLDGIEAEGTVLIAQEPKLHELLPAAIRLNEHGIRARSYTDHDNYLAEMCKELI